MASMKFPANIKKITTCCDGGAVVYFSIPQEDTISTAKLFAFMDTNLIITVEDAPSNV